MGELRYSRPREAVPGADPAVDPRLARARAAQLGRWRATLAAGATRVGWKLGVGDAERDRDELAIGHLTSATVLEPGATYRAGGAGDLRADAEVAFELGRPATPALSRDRPRR